MFLRGFRFISVNFYLKSYIHEYRQDGLTHVEDYPLVSYLTSVVTFKRDEIIPIQLGYERSKFIDVLLRYRFVLLLVKEYVSACVCDVNKHTHFHFSSYPVRFHAIVTNYPFTDVVFLNILIFSKSRF